MMAVDERRGVLLMLTTRRHRGSTWSGQVPAGDRVVDLTRMLLTATAALEVGEADALAGELGLLVVAETQAHS